MTSRDCFLSPKHKKNKLKDKRLDEDETIKYTAMEQLLLAIPKIESDKSFQYSQE
jgi:hypothetical protein